MPGLWERLFGPSKKSIVVAIEPTATAASGRNVIIGEASDAGPKSADISVETELRKAEETKRQAEAGAQQAAERRNAEETKKRVEEQRLKAEEVMRYAEAARRELQALLDNGGEVDTKAQTGKSALMLASELADSDVVRALLNQGADVNARGNSGWTSLMFASGKGHDEVVRTLLNEGADVNAGDNSGWTALMLASEKGHDRVVESLIDRGADVNASNGYGSTPLMKASENGHEVVVRVLIRKGAEVSAKGNNGRTALTLALEKGQDEVVRTLLDNGADMNAESERSKADEVKKQAAAAAWAEAESRQIEESKKQAEANARAEIERRRQEEAMRLVEAAKRSDSIVEINRGKSTGAVSETTDSLDRAFSIFFDTILPRHRIIPLAEAENSLRRMAESATPTSVLRTQSLEHLKALMRKKAIGWDTEQTIDSYEIQNINGFGAIAEWATFEARSDNPEDKIERRGIFVIGSVRRRVINVWKTQAHYIAWSSFPWEGSAADDLGANVNTVKPRGDHTVRTRAQCFKFYPDAIFSSFEFAIKQIEIVDVRVDRKYDSDFWLVYKYADESERQRAWANVTAFAKEENGTWYVENYDMPLYEIERQLAIVNHNAMQALKSKRDQWIARKNLDATKNP